MFSILNHRAFVLGGAALLLGAATSAQAAEITELQFDVNSVTIQATSAQGSNSAFGGNTHTGSLIFSIDGNSTLELFLDGSKQTSMTATFTGFSGQVNFVNGVTTGGSFTITVQNADLSLDTYTADVQSGARITSAPPGSNRFRSFGFQFSALTDNGAFSDANYGGFSAGTFDSQEPLSGLFFQLRYLPDAQGRSTDGHIDIFTLATIPSPAAATGGMLLLGTLAAGRRRR